MQTEIISGNRSVTPIVSIASNNSSVEDLQSIVLSVVSVQTNEFTALVVHRMILSTKYSILLFIFKAFPQNREEIHLKRKND